jgi:hypothetical protein
MRLLLIAALVCFILALISTLGPTLILGATFVPWMLGGFIAVVLDWLFGERLVTPNARKG